MNRLIKYVPVILPGGPTRKGFCVGIERLSDGRTNYRCLYGQLEAQQVCDWLNGLDKPIRTVPRIMDPWDPAVRFPKRPTRRI